MIQLTERQWLLLASVLALAYEAMPDPELRAILDSIGEFGELAAHEGVAPVPLANSKN